MLSYRERPFDWEVTPVTSPATDQTFLGYGNIPALIGHPRTSQIFGMPPRLGTSSEMQVVWVR